MEDKNYYMQEPVGESGVAQTRNPYFLSENYEPFKAVPTKYNVGNIVKTPSKYNETLGNLEELEYKGLTLEDLKSNDQTNWNRLGNALVNNITIAGTTIVGGTLGLAYGLIDAAATQEISKIWNNAVTNATANIQSSVQEAFPIYKGNEYNNKNILEKIGSGIFWADVLQNLGYAEAMLVSGGAMSSVLKNAPKAIRGFVPSFTSSLQEASVEAVHNKNEEIKNKTKMADMQYNQLSLDPNVDLENLYIDYQQTLSDIEDDSIKSGNFIFGSNIALLTLSNQIQFGNLFSRGFNTAKRLKGAARRKGEKYAMENLGLTLGKTVGTKILDATTEGLEELSQGVITEVPQNYIEYNSFNESKFNPENRELAANLWSATGKAFSDAMKDPRTAEEFASGFIIGMFGIPRVKTKGFPLTIENNIAMEMIDTYKAYKKQEAIVNEINDKLDKSDKIQTYYDGLVRHLAIQDAMNNFVEDDKEYDYKTAESAQFISDIMMFDEIGDINRLKEIINNSVDYSDDNIKSLIEDTTKDGEGPFVSNGNAKTVEEVKKIIKDKQTSLLEKVDYYTNTKDIIERTYPDFQEETIKELLFLKAQHKDHLDRYLSLSNSLYSKIKPLDLDKTSFENSNIGPLNEATLPLYLSNEKFLNEVTRALSFDISITKDEVENIIKDFDDLSKILTGLNKLNNSINTLIEKPEISSTTVDDVKNKIVNKFKERELNKIKKELDNKSNNVQEFRSAVDKLTNEGRDQELINKAILELDKNNNSQVSEYLKINNTYQTTLKAINNSKYDDVTKETATVLLNKALQNSKSLSEFTDIHSPNYFIDANNLKYISNTHIARELLINIFNNNSKEQKENEAIITDIEDIDISDSTDSKNPETEISEFSELENPEKGDTFVPVTGYDNVFTAPPVTEETLPKQDVPSEETPIQESALEVQNEHSDKNDEELKKETENTNTQNSYLFTNSTEWNPAISELHRPSIREGIYQSTAKAHPSFKDIWTYLYNANAFKYVNEGKLKEGETVYFGYVLDSESDWIKNSLFVFVKTDSGYQILSSLYRSGTEQQLAEVIKVEMEESTIEENQKYFISSKYSSKVASLKTGVIMQDETLRPLHVSIAETSLHTNNIVLSVIKGPAKMTGGFLDTHNEIQMPNDFASKNGQTYIEIPNVKQGTFGGRTAMPLKVASYGDVLHPVNGYKFEDTKIYSRIQKAIKKMANAQTQSELLEAFKSLGTDLVTKRISVYLTSDGKLRINQRVFDDKGNLVYKEVKGKTVEVQIPHTIERYNNNGEPIEEQIIVDAINYILKNVADLRFKTNLNFINTGNYNQELINSGIVSSYLVRTEERNAWFTVEAINPNQLNSTEESVEEEPIIETNETVATETSENLQQEESSEAFNSDDLNFELDLDGLMTEFSKGQVNTDPNIEYQQSNTGKTVNNSIEFKKQTLLNSDKYTINDINNMSNVELDTAFACINI